MYIKQTIFIVLYAVVTMASAQSEEQLPDKVTDSEINAEAEKDDKLSAEDAEAIIEYNIYRKDHPDNPCARDMDTYDYEKSWYDETQIYINSRFCEPALWFDNFFANDRIYNEGVAGTYVRWRNEFTYDEEEGYKYDMGINASVELPGFSDQLRLTFDNDEDEDIRDVAPGAGEDSANSLGLQLDLRENARSKFNVRVSFSPKILFRYRYTYPVYDSLILRFTQEVQRKKQVNSARTLIDVEHAFKPQFLFRSSTEGKVSEEFEGVDWLQAFVLYQRINKKTSLSYESSVNGISEPQTLATNYRLGLRFRKNFHRRWLFYEVSPEMTWPITLDEERFNVVKERRSKWLLFFRLEVHFGNAYKKRYEDYN
jgi:hypothetical protein